MLEIDLKSVLMVYISFYLNRFLLGSPVSAGNALDFETYSKPRLHHVGAIWKRPAFSSWERIKMFSDHTTPREIWKRNNHRTFWIYVSGKLGQGSRTIIVT